MEFTKNNKLGYLQAAISFVIILQSFFLPYYENLYVMGKFSMIFMDNIPSMAFVAIFILSLVANIFVQSKKSIGWLSLAVSVVGCMTILICHLDTCYNYDYSIGFYLNLISLLAFFTLSLVIFITSVVNAKKMGYSSIPQPVAASARCANVNTIHTVSNSEIEELKARSAKLKAEREKLNAELEDELRKEELKALKAKTEKLEKELMARELAELKAKLEKYENTASQTSEEN